MVHDGVHHMNTSEPIADASSPNKHTSQYSVDLKQSI